MHPIQMNKNTLDKVLKNISKELMEEKWDSQIKNIKIDVGKAVKSKTPTPKVMFTTLAWLKMFHLVQNQKKEVGWQGTVTRQDNNFIIQDILVYPQIVSAASVDTDEKELGDWYTKLPDEVFNKLRFQGHSHVDMGVKPSKADLDMYETYLKMLPENDFFIFLIINKSLEMNMFLYDLKENIKYYTQDIQIITPISGLEKWYSKSTEQIIEPKRASKILSNTAYPEEYEYYGNATRGRGNRYGFR